MSDYYEKQHKDYLKSLKNPKYFKVDEVSIIVKPEDKDGKTFFYDLCGNRVTKISRKPKDTSIVNDCYLGLKKFKNSERWVPIKSEDVDERLSDKEFIKNHSKEYNPEKVKTQKKDNLKEDNNNIFKTLNNINNTEIKDFQNYIIERNSVDEDFFINHLKRLKNSHFDYSFHDGRLHDFTSLSGFNYNGFYHNRLYIRFYLVGCFIRISNPIKQIRQVKRGIFSTTEKLIITDVKNKFLKFSLGEDEFIDEIDLKKIELDNNDLEFLQNFISKFGSLLKSEYENFLKFKSNKRTISYDLDKDNNGIIDVIEGTGDELTKLLRKHQLKVIEVDKNYVQSIIKISNYLKNKRENIQSLFHLIKESSNDIELEDNMGILKNNIHTHNLVLFHSLNLITSIVENDIITFYEIYESFDKLKIFNTSWENEVSQKLTDINLNLNQLINSIDKMERSIVKEIGNLTYVTEQSFKELGKTVTEELQSIDSSIKFNNLLTGISTYQLYKINKQTKGLLKG